MSNPVASFMDNILIRVGALPAKKFTWGLVVLFTAWVLIDVFALQLTDGLTQSSFDAMVRKRIYSAAPDPRIVIIDIDEASLARMNHEFGRWPWPRDTLATVLEYVERQQPAAVVWDVLFADPDRTNPGGDAAFNAAANHSEHSHFSVVRLPKENDALSQITRAELPSLWLSDMAAENQRATATKPSSLALIPPILPAIAKGHMGYNNGYVDRDGVLRRYRYAERLPDQSAIYSLPLSVAKAVNPAAYTDYINGSGTLFQDELMVWRGHPDIYPRVSIADVFALAEGGKSLLAMPSFKGKIVIIGATAPSLHDMHPTPLSPSQLGVDTLATAIDNILNNRHLAELPRWLEAIFAISMCAGLAIWVQHKGAATLAPALLALPAALMGISYLSLNGLPVFLDLHLPAGLALAFLAILSYWRSLRRIYWCTPATNHDQPLLLCPMERLGPWLDHDLDRLIDELERHAPTCRVVVCDAHVTWPATLRWPELAQFAAIIGPKAEMIAAQQHLLPALKSLVNRYGETVTLNQHADRPELAKAVQTAWTKLLMNKSSTEQQDFSCNSS
jgi:CHASE2 domain-containing sensor protein